MNKVQYRYQWKSLFMCQIFTIFGKYKLWFSSSISRFLFQHTDISLIEPTVKWENECILKNTHKQFLTVNSISFYLRTHIKQSHNNCMAFLLRCSKFISSIANRFAVVAYISIMNSAYTNQWTTKSQLDNSWPLPNSVVCYKWVKLNKLNIRNTIRLGYTQC